MRLNQTDYHETENYTSELKLRAEQAFDYSSQMVELKRILAKIKEEAVKLRSLFMTNEEQQENFGAMEFFDQRMQSMVYTTIQNMQKYQLYGWEELIYDGDIENEPIN